MNTHDKYELPPLPQGYCANEIRPNYARQIFLENQVRDYALSAIEPYAKRIAELESQLEAIGAGGVTQGQRLIEADHQRRGEPVAMSNDKMRAEFDSWIEQQGMSTMKDGETYYHHATHVAWQAWKASHDALLAAAVRKAEPVAWLYEDELPDNYPYEAMFAYRIIE